MNFEILERTGFATFDRSARQQLDTLGGFLSSLGVEDEIGQNIMKDLAALTATEIALVMHEPVETVQNLLPVQVSGRTFNIMIQKTDTMPTLQCETPERASRGDLRLEDIFIFSSDIEKVHKFNGDDDFAKKITIMEILTDFNRFMDSFLAKSTEVMFGSRADQAYLRLALQAESAIWRLRLSVLTTPSNTGRNMEEFIAYGSHVNLPLGEFAY